MPSEAAANAPHLYLLYLFPRSGEIKPSTYVGAPSAEPLSGGEAGSPRTLALTRNPSCRNKLSVPTSVGTGLSCARSALVLPGHTRGAR